MVACAAAAMLLGIAPCQSLSVCSRCIPLWGFTQTLGCAFLLLLFGWFGGILLLAVSLVGLFGGLWDVKKKKKGNME